MRFPITVSEVYRKVRMPELTEGPCAPSPCVANGVAAESLLYLAT